MPRECAFRVVGTLARQTPQIILMASRGDLPGLCVAAAENVIDCMCSFYAFLNEKERTTILKQQLDNQLEKHEEINKDYERVTDLIAEKEEQKVRIELEKLKTQLQEELREFKAQTKQASINAFLESEVLTHKYRINSRLRMQLKEVLDNLNKVAELRRQRGLGDMPEEYMEKYRIFLNSYNKLVKSNL